MPTFDYNIQVLKQVLQCLENGNEMNVCLEHLSNELKKQHQDKSSQQSITVEENQRNEIREKQIKQDIKQRINQQDISKEQIIVNLRKLLVEAEEVRLCLNKGQTANDLKDCVVQYKNKSKL